MKYTFNKNEAVSPVVGVMLMLVVTIIIAAVVSGFAGGLAGGTEAAPQAAISATNFEVSGVIDNTPDNRYGQELALPNQGLNVAAAADIYVTFEHKGGDSLNLDQIEVNLGKQSEVGVSSLISRTLTPQAGTALSTSQGDFGGSIGDKSLISGENKNWEKYLEKYPDNSSVVIKPGDRFVLHADYGARVNGVNSIAWHQQGGAYGFPISAGDVLTYDIIDKASKKVIASGKIAVPEFSVRTS